MLIKVNFVRSFVLYGHGKLISVPLQRKSVRVNFSKPVSRLIKYPQTFSVP